MSEFNFNIGEVPEHWQRKYGARVINGDFKYGPMAQLEEGFRFDDFSGAMPATFCAYRFHYEQRRKVKAWIDWYMKEYEGE